MKIPRFPFFQVHFILDGYIELPSLSSIEMGDKGVLITLSNLLVGLLQSGISVPINNEVTKLNFTSNQFNTMRQLTFTGFPYLETLIIPENCFKRVRKVSFFNLPSLRNVTIEEKSFYPYLTDTWSDGYEAFSDSEFSLYNCSLLEKFSTDRFTFTFFKIVQMESCCMGFG